MTLLLIAAAGLLGGLWVRSTRSGRSGLVAVGTSAEPVVVLGSQRESAWLTRRLLSGVAIAVALLLSGVAVGLIAVPSQVTVAPAQQGAASAAAAGAELHLARGERLSAVHDYNGAIAEYTLAIQLKPDYAEAYNDRGFAHYLKGEAEPAIADFTQAIALRPNYPKAYNSRGVTYMSNGYGSARAVADFDRAIALKPDFRYAYINRANARLLSHPWLALDDFHRAGMYPERTVAMVIGALLAFVTALAVVRRRRHMPAGRDR